MRGKGYTLLELVITMVILAALAAAGLAFYAKLNDDAKKAEVRPVISSIYKAQKIYRTRYGGYVKCGNYWGGSNSEIEEKLGMKLDPVISSRWWFDVKVRWNDDTVIEYIRAHGHKEYYNRGFVVQFEPDKGWVSMPDHW